MHEVKSKYKNPDQFIQGLKNKLAIEKILKKCSDAARKLAHGERIISCSKDWKQKVGVTSEAFGNLSLGEKVALIGIVESNGKYFNDDGEICSRMTINVKEFRKFKV